MADEREAKPDEGLDDGAHSKSNAPQFLDFSQINAGDDVDVAEDSRLIATPQENDDFFTPSNVTLASPTGVDESEVEAEITIEDSTGETGTGVSVDNKESEDLASRPDSVPLENDSENLNGNTDADADADAEEDATKVEEGDGTEPEPEDEEGTSGAIREDIEVTAIVEAAPQELEEALTAGAEVNENNEAEDAKETNVQTLFGFGNPEAEEAEAEIETAVANNTAALESEIALAGPALVSDEILEDGEKNETNENLTENEPQAAAVETNESETILEGQVPPEDDQKEEEPPAKGKSKKKESKITVPQPFKLHQSRAKVEDPKPEEYKFKAKPAPKKILASRPTELKTKANVKLTNPVQPHFKSDARLQERHEKKESVLAKQTASNDGTKASTHTSTSSLSVKPPTAPTPTKATPSTPTKIKPFSFEERNKEMQKKKQMRLQEKLEKEEAKPFKFVAKPAPVFAPKLAKTASDTTTNSKLANEKVAEKDKGNKNKQAKATKKPADCNAKKSSTQEVDGNANETPDLTAATD